MHIPYTFSYVFECADRKKPHTAVTEDWDLGVRYLQEVARLGNEAVAVESVRDHFFNQLCAPPTPPTSSWG